MDPLPPRRTAFGANCMTNLAQVSILQIRNENSGKVMGVENYFTVNGANIQQFKSSGSRDLLWRFIATASGWWKIQNLHSGLLLAVEGGSTANCARLQQFEDNGSEDHLWAIQSQGDGLVLICNKKSRKAAGIDGMSTAHGAQVVQFENNGTKDLLWRLFPASAECCSRSRQY